MHTTHIILLSYSSSKHPSPSYAILQSRIRTLGLGSPRMRKKSRHALSLYFPYYYQFPFHLSSFSAIISPPQPYTHTHSHSFLFSRPAQLWERVPPSKAKHLQPPKSNNSVYALSNYAMYFCWPASTFYTTAFAFSMSCTVAGLGAAFSIFQEFSL